MYDRIVYFCYLFRDNKCEKYSKITLVVVGFMLNLLQAAFTTLMDDEAYYWLYGQNLDWGYFHQPPLIGIFLNLLY